MDIDWPGQPPDYSKPPRGELTVAQVAAMIDHSLLRPELTLDDVTLGCEIAAAHEVASVCCKPADVVHASRALAGTPVLVGTVVGFPHGSSTTETKVFEARGALNDGARELDMVINIGRLRGGEHAYVAADIRAVVEVAGTTGALVKVIFENAYLTDDEKVRACHLTEEAGADLIKTSTGFAASGATMEDLALMRRSRPRAVCAHSTRCSRWWQSVSADSVQRSPWQCWPTPRKGPAAASFGCLPCRQSARA
jgi:deoxyribose-phosphate aldolase